MCLSPFSVPAFSSQRRPLFHSSAEPFGPKFVVAIDLTLGTYLFSTESWPQYVRTPSKQGLRSRVDAFQKLLALTHAFVRSGHCILANLLQKTISALPQL